MREAERDTTKRAKRLRREMTKAETILWRVLRKKNLDGYRFRRQVPIGPYIADFACVLEKFIVEVDGATHASDDEIAYDLRRTAYLTSEGWLVHRVSNADIYENLDGTLSGIETALGAIAGSFKD
jgi:very-short-patch-repair endonuclease